MPTRWAADPEATFTGYTPPEPMAKHAARKPSWPARLRAWWRKLRR